MIRAFGKEEYFIEHSNFLLNRVTVIEQYTEGLFNWMSLRLSCFAALNLAASCFLIIVMRNDVSPVLLSMMLTYLLTLKSSV